MKLPNRSIQSTQNEDVNVHQVDRVKDAATVKDQRIKVKHDNPAQILHLMIMGVLILAPTLTAIIMGVILFGMRSAIKGDRFQEGIPSLGYIVFAIILNSLLVMMLL